MSELKYKPSDHFIAAKPLPLPEKPYSREEVEDYAWRYFNGEDKNRQLAKAERLIYDKYRTRFIDFIENQPNWLQVMVTENRVPVRLGKREFINLKKGNWGYSTPDTLDTRLPVSLMRLRGDHFEHYLSHELAHDVDNILGLMGALPIDYQHMIYYSENQTGWFRAVERDLTQPNGHSKRNLNHELRSTLMRYKPEEHAFEAFAFVMSYYFSGYFRLMSAAKEDLGMDVAAEKANLRATMHRFFPAMWKQFEDEIKPHIEAVASELYETRKVRQRDSGRRREVALRAAMEGAIAKRGWPAVDDPALVIRLAHGMNTDWQYLFESLQRPIPPTMSGKLRAFFPMIFNPRYEGLQCLHDGKQRPFMLNDFPELRGDLEAFFTHLDAVAKKQGITAFVEQYSKLNDSLDDAAAALKKGSRDR